MTCVANPKSNGIIERFHSTLIEHLRIINQRTELKNTNLQNKVNMALIAYDDSINLTTKLTPNDVLFGKEKEPNLFKVNVNDNDYIKNHHDEQKIVHEIVQDKIINENFKRHKQDYVSPDRIPNEVRIKANKRLIHKIKKPLYQTHEAESYNPNLGVIKLNENKKFKITKIKTPSRFYITDAPRQEDAWRK